MGPNNTNAPSAGRIEPEPSARDLWLRLALVALLLLVFLAGIRGLGSGFKGLGKELLTSFFAATENPFTGLFVGILGTTLMQSSSVTTSMIVAMVAAPDNPLPVANAIPMIMGANIGTTVTNTIVSLGHMSRPDEFRRAFAAATCHDFFNFMTVALLLPLEVFTGMLSKVSAAAVSTFQSLGGGGKLPNPIKEATKAMVKPVESVLEGIAGDPKVAAGLLIFLSAAVIFSTLLLIVRTLRSLVATRLQGYITRSLDSNAYVGIVVGIIVTVMVQSSSITTSILVPLAGAGIVTLQQVFPVTLGANIGTTITALMASLAAPAETAHLAVQVAGVHLLFNLLGTAIVYPVPQLRAIPLKLAEKLAEVAVRSKSVALAYVVGLFYGLPAVLVFVTKVL